VVFRPLFVLVALLVGLGACASPGGPAATVGANGVPVLPRELERDVGPAYPDPALQAYVERVGQKVVSQSGLKSAFRFVVLDQPQANAHAAGGYVMVTRGLLALLDDEAELAAAMSHEIGHVVERHAAQRARARQGVLDAAVEAAASTGSITVGRSVAREGLLALRRYSREQELEADKAGVAMLVKAGYRGSAMSSLIDKLRREGQLELQLMGEQPDAIDRRSSTSTHPAPIERQEALQSIPQAAASGESNRTVFLEAIDNMSVDDSPQEGYVRGNRFEHPVLKVAFQAPRDFRLFNDDDGVLGVGRDRSLMFFSCTDSPVQGDLADWMRSKLKPTPVDIQSTEIDGSPAAIGARPRGADAGLGQVRYVLIRHDDQVCFFNLLSEGPDRDRRIDVLIAAARTFHVLTDAEAAALRPYRLRVVASAGITPAQLAQRLPYADLKMERLLILNGVRTPDELSQRDKVKIIEP
jgi:predicted Zn-dependent protease